MKSLMKICLLNGMSKSNNIESVIINNLKEYKVNNLILREMNIEPCSCCNACSFTGKCVKNDDGIEVVNGYKEAEVIILLTSIRYGAYSKELKKAIDRTLPIGESKLLVKEGYMIHKIKYNNKKVVVIGVLDEEDKDQEESFSALVKANYYNMDWKKYKQAIIYNSSDNKNKENSIRTVLKEVIENV